MKQARLPILFIPGTLCTNAIFATQIERLEAGGAQVHQLSILEENTINQMADKAIALMKAQPMAVVGFSMGGMVAMAIARKAPELIGRLALINTNYFADAPERADARRKHIAEARAGRLLPLLESEFLANYFYRETEANRNLILKMAAELGEQAFIAQLMALQGRQDSSDTLAQISCKTLIIGAENDPLCTPDTHRNMHHLIKGSELEILKDCGHFSVLEKGQAVASSLLVWWASEA